MDKSMETKAYQRMKFDPKTGEFKANQPRFIRTIPFDWLKRCNALPGKATQVATGLWFLAGVKRSFQFKLTGEAVELVGCSRSAIRRGLATLEAAGLIEVERHCGARPTIKIKEQLAQPESIH